MLRILMPIVIIAVTQFICDFDGLPMCTKFWRVFKKLIVYIKKKLDSDVMSTNLEESYLATFVHLHVRSCSHILISLFFFVLISTSITFTIRDKSIMILVGTVRRGRLATVPSFA